MKNKYISFFTFLICLGCQLAVAQGTDQRTLSTKIADLLNRFPADEKSILENNMQQMASLGREGITEMALMLSEGGDNEKLEYALSGFAFYASEPDRSDLARMTVQAFGKAIDQLDYVEGQAFLIRQLQWVGKEDAAPFLEGYLHHGELAGTAARVLDNIASSSAEQALILALKTSDNPKQIKHYIGALGDMKSEEALEDITPYLQHSDPQVRKLAIYALSQIASPSSAKSLANAAKDADYTYEPTNASSSYLRYIKGLAERGEAKRARKLALQVHKQASSTHQSHTRAGALRLLNELDSKRAQKLIHEGALSADPLYRGAALKLALANDPTKSWDDWKKTLDNANTEAKIAIIQMAGYLEGPTVTATLLPFLNHSEDRVAIAAIESIVRVAGDAPLDQLLDLVNEADENKLRALETAFKTMPGKEVTSKIGQKIEGLANNYGKIMLLNVLASRAASDQAQVAFRIAENSDGEVQTAAIDALPALVNPEHRSALIALLKGTENTEHMKKLGEALVNATLRVGDEKAQALWVDQNLNELDKNKQTYLYDILGQTGGKVALSQLIALHEKGNNAQKSAAIEALSKSSDLEAAFLLLDLARGARQPHHRESAVQGLIAQIPQLDLEEESKVIYLREALTLSYEGDTKKLALNQLGGYPTFQALVAAGAYLEDPALQQAAARAVMNIVSERQDLYGETVRGLVSKTRDVISGQDSQYFKTSLQKYLDEMPQGRGFYPIFDGQSLEGWQGVFSNPIKRAEMTESSRNKEQSKANETMREGWKAEDGLLIFTGKGENIGTELEFGNFELMVDWKITPDGDAGIYLRGTPQVQIWDIARTEVGAEVGSGGLYNNQTHPSDPEKVADHAIGEWNTFHIKMMDEKVTVYLNGEKVVDKVTLENYWDRSQPIFPTGPIELQAHGTYVAYRDLYVKELDHSPTFELSDEEKAEGFEVLFDGTNMDSWRGNLTDYVIEDGVMAIFPDRGGKGNLYTMKEFSDFIFRFEFKLTPGANNGLGIRMPKEGDAAYEGMELQILDDSADIYRNLKEYQFHGSLYGIAAAQRGHLMPVGEWNYQEVRVKGDQIQVELNGNLILDVDISEAREKGTVDGRDHPGLSREEGHIGFLGHGDIVYFRNIRVLDLND
jgi:HEAT repeat protein